MGKHENQTKIKNCTKNIEKRKSYENQKQNRTKTREIGNLVIHDLVRYPLIYHRMPDQRVDEDLELESLIQRRKYQAMKYEIQSTKMKHFHIYSLTLYVITLDPVSQPRSCEWILGELSALVY